MSVLKPVCRLLPRRTPSAAPALLSAKGTSLTQVCHVTPKCHVTPVDCFGWNTPKDYLGKTLKEHRILPTAGSNHHQNLRTRNKRLKPPVPDELDMQKFALETFTPRKFTVDLPAEYTIEPLRKTQSAGRDPNTGRIAIHGRGGGIKRWFRWVDFNRLGPSEEADLQEKVLWLSHDLNRSNHIALVASGTTKRYILATENMKVGDVIKSTRFIPKVLDNLDPGDAHPVGAMPEGTQLCQLEVFPRHGATKLRAAGSSGRIIRRLDNGYVSIQLPSKHEIQVDKHCMAVVGQNGHASHYKEKIGSPNRKRWMGIRPQSGWFQRKTGRFGRKLNKNPKMIVCEPHMRSKISQPPLACRK